jgi:hypothetical protein
MARVPESPFFWIDKSTCPNGVALKEPSASGCGTDDVKAGCSKELQGATSNRPVTYSRQPRALQNSEFQEIGAAPLILSSVRDRPARALRAVEQLDALGRELVSDPVCFREILGSAGVCPSFDAGFD